ncbi:V-type ATP synthase subunit I [Soehngenia longivitae]|uniref:V-type ATP synthase subunit I n=1 Tax=Soehngenia longivitae TaxID=2562294 RepID=A0A4Z0D939_9FIRM|nr:V-type ATP synthase subunit I [Soehngenia longivitae]TFZ41394.1 V-type ATP synthase subunit I [Soehngenia longivitae]
MAIVKMSEFSLFAFDVEKEALLKTLQNFGYVHFSNLTEEFGDESLGLEPVKVPHKLTEIEEKLSKVSSAVSILSKYEQKESSIKAMMEGNKTYSFEELEKIVLDIDYIALADEILSLSKEKDDIVQKIEHLRTEIDELKPWQYLGASIETLSNTYFSDITIGTVSRKLKEKLIEIMSEAENGYYEIINEDKNNLYLLLISHKSDTDDLIDSLKNLSFTKVKLQIKLTPDEEIKIREEKIKKYELEIEEIENNLKERLDYLENLKLAFDYLNNLKLRFSVSENFIKTEKVVFIKGYIPTSKKDEFEKSVREALGNVYYLEIKEAEKENPKVPILLENSNYAETFESLTGMYALPKYSEIDPTPFLAPFYTLFFGMMAADVGYGLIMLLGTFFALKKFKLSDAQRKSIKFFYYLSFSVIIWGFIYGSLFGGVVKIPGLIDPANDYNTVLLMSIAFGVIHVMFALGLKAYMLIRDRKILDALFDVGFWYFALIGSIVFLLSTMGIIGGVIKTISLVMMIVGMLGIVATGGRSSGSIGGKLAGGFYSLYGITGYIGDFVSYSRLMALGLAGGFIAGAINMIAGMVSGLGVVGFILAIVIFIAGQLFNLGLSLLGAYVHSIRLIYVEFFGKFYEGGGPKFNLLRAKPKYINIK